MNITEVQLDDTLTHIALAGRLDAVGIKNEDLKFYAITAGRHLPALLDLSEVSFMSSVGIRMFIKSAKGLYAEGKRMALLNPIDTVRELLEVAGVDELLPIYTDAREAKDFVLRQDD